MADKSTQSLRIASEATHAQQDQAHHGRATAIVSRYRLQPEDLPGGQWAGRVNSINTQGVEALTSLVFVEGLAKPLAVGEEDVQTLVRMTNSPFAGDWIGCKVELRAVRVSGARLVRLYAPGAAGLPVDAPAPPVATHRRRPWRALMLFLLAVALIAGLVYAVEQGPLVWALVEETILSSPPP
ncbi:hypothetical protein [Caldilinea sp.]|uniref:hypothetical protein n=1 Tax=Caldilinea sp. TaxID=2293560 RepID=UPI002B5E9519|nr:hypothetical protein [Anaerolineales bacterium]HQY92969.1 hypothetical protein [Caldilinea sp.]